MNPREKRLEKAQMRVLFQVPFFAPGVAKLPVRFLPEAQYRASFGTPQGQLATACTNGEELAWCEEFFDKLQDQELVTVLAHEVAHCMLGHCWRAPSGADWDVWNQAADHAVNLMLKEFAEQVQAKRLANPFPFPDPQDAYCANPSFKDHSEEQIYNMLNSQRPPGGSGSKPGAGSGKGGSGAGKPAPGSMPAFGQIVKPKGGQADPAQQRKLANDWTATLLQAAQMSKGRGDLPAGLARLVEDITTAKVPWWEYIQAWLREQCSDDWDWQTPAMEFSDSGFILPSMRSDRVGSIVFATDTSGSIDHEVLAHFQAEKQNCLDNMRPKKLVDIYCDSAIHKQEEYGPGDTISKDAPGGGGTDFRPVFKRCAKMEEQPRCLVYLTDLDGSFPEADPGYPVLWVTWGRGGSAPFGQVVYAGD